MSQSQNQPLSSGDGTSTFSASFFLHAHSHPHSDQQARSPSATSSTTNSLRVRASSEPNQQLRQQPQYSPRTHQQRRLLLRNAGFPGVVFPARDIAWTPVNAPKTNCQSCYEEDDEETPRPSRRKRHNVEETPANPLGILEEISNSSIRRKSSWGTEFGPVLQDQNNTSTLDDAGKSSWTTESGENISPQRGEGVLKAEKMRSQGGTLNPHTPSPISKGKMRVKRTSRLRSKSLDNARYIEHLESQLAALQTQLQSLTSPTTTKTQSAKLRALTSESRVLRQEVQEWENKFNERVREALDARVEVESGLRTKIRQLERELEIKEGRAAELQREVERLERASKEAGAVQAENFNLERRLDVLTEILAQSPTKVLPPAELAASIANGEGRKKPRPKSMIPRIIHSGSPFVAPLPMPKAPEAKRNSVVSNFTESTSGQPQWGDEYEDLLHHYPSKRNRVSTDVESIFSQAPTMSSTASTQGSASRPLSMISDASAGSPCWDLGLLPLSTPRSSQSYTNRPRRMRRFPSGSSAPKTLILPTTSNIMSLPASAPAEDASGFTYEHSKPRDSMSAVLPSTNSGLPFSTPKPSSKSSTSSWAQQETLRVLEANSAINRSFPDAPEVSPSTSLRSSYQQRNSSITREETPCPGGESLFVEISRVEGGLCQSPEAVETQPPHLHNYVSRGQQHDMTPGRSSKPQIGLPAKAPVTTLAGHLGNFFAQFSALLAELWNHPARIARRLLSAVWWSSSTVADFPSKANNELGWWWVLGLLLRPFSSGSAASRQEKEKDEEAPPPTAVGQRASGFDWHLYSSEASEASKARLFAHRKRDIEENTSATLLEETKDEVIPGVKPNTETKAMVIHYPHPVSPPKKLHIWFKFAVALVLAVGVAIRDGPDFGEGRPMLSLLAPPDDCRDKSIVRVDKGSSTEHLPQQKDCGIELKAWV